MISCRTHSLAHPAQRLGRLQRLSIAALGLTVLAVWDPLAHPGPKLCLLRHAVGLPCPLCGLTRGVSLGLRGHFAEASSYNPLAIPILVFALLLGVKWGVEYAAGRQVEVSCSRRVRLLLAGAVHVAILAAWAYLLMCRREDDFAGCWLGRLLR